MKINSILTSAEWPLQLPHDEPMNGIAVQNAKAYATRYQLRLAERLGFGIHGTVHVAEDKLKGDISAIKAHLFTEPYLRERVVYERLRESDVTEVLGFHVPQLIRVDDELRVLEMTVVTRPFVLDFAGAYLEQRPEFSEEIWSQWETQKQEQFGARWTIVLDVMDAFASLGIYLVDVSPTNIGFKD